MLRTVKLLVLLCFLVHFVDSPALTCGGYDLDAKFKSADSVFVAQLVSAAMSENYAASGTLVLKETLKGDPPETLDFETNIGPFSYCGPDLTIGKAYLIFLAVGNPMLLDVSGGNPSGGGPTILKWIEEKMHVRGAT